MIWLNLTCVWQLPIICLSLKWTVVAVKGNWKWDIKKTFNRLSDMQMLSWGSNEDVFQHRLVQDSIPAHKQAFQKESCHHSLFSGSQSYELENRGEGTMSQSISSHVPLRPLHVQYKYSHHEFFFFLHLVKFQIQTCIFYVPYSNQSTDFCVALNHNHASFSILF